MRERERNDVISFTIVSVCVCYREGLYIYIERERWSWNTFSINGGCECPTGKDHLEFRATNCLCEADKIELEFIEKQTQILFFLIVSFRDII